MSADQGGACDECAYVCPPGCAENMESLRGRGVRFIEPGEGQLACGYVGKGRLAEPEEIMAAVES